MSEAIKPQELRHMYGRFTLLKKYLNYYLTAGNGKGHGMHSPFVFKFITEVLNDHARYPAYEEVEALRSRMRKDMRVITVEDYGAGSLHAAGRDRSIKEIATNAAKPRRFGQLMFRMVRYYGFSEILELGTSLGITTAYLASATGDGKVTTIEGSKNIAAVAADNFAAARLRNVKLITGNFDEELPRLLAEGLRPDLVFVDGNHRYQPTTSYFKQLLTVAGNNTVMIFDDIHWSQEMERAWEEIKNNASVTCTIDLFFIGIVFLRKEFHHPQHFTVRF